jgi:DNA polymerase III epsilon subunit-like protein
MDLEMCKVPKSARQSFGSGTELIQIGAVFMNDDYKVIKSFMTYVKPEFGRIDPFIENLTGISPADVENAPTAAEALKMFYDQLTEDSILVTWSDNDTRQIDDELYFKDIDLPELYDYLDHYIDCQLLFADKLLTDRKYRLSEALTIANIDYAPGAHDALVDAKNTAMLFAKADTTDGSALCPYFMTPAQASGCIFNSFRPAVCYDRSM